ncbi:hypothetical protein ACFLUH_04355, partial [Chloroflexota bacterium]
ISLSGISTTYYRDFAIVESACSEARYIVLNASNNMDTPQQATAYVSLPLQFKAYFTYRVNPTLDPEYPNMLEINYRSLNLGGFASPRLTSVVLKANGQIWDSSGDIWTDDYGDVFTKLVDRDGGTFNIEVIATNDDGDKYIYRRTVEIPAIPSGQPPKEPQYPPPPQTTLWAKVSAGTQCTAYGPECSCQLVISLNGLDLTTGTYPVTQAVLKVNGEVWHDSGGLLVTQYQHVVERTVNCGETYNMELTVNNSLGQTITSNVSITTPSP